VVVRALAIGAFALPVFVAVSACGPGLEAVHESNLRFEHCYRLDMDQNIAASHREHCWRYWTENYATDQPLDHIEYARRRIVALESGDHSLVTVRTGAPTEGRVFEEVGPAPDAPMAAPAPTSAHEPPPKTEPVAPPPPATPRPGDDCAAQCAAPLNECQRLCDAKQADCATCREEYRRCMRRCFE